jgi:hypothetical protein
MKTSIVGYFIMSYRTEKTPNIGATTNINIIDKITKLVLKISFDGSNFPKTDGENQIKAKIKTPVTTLIPLQYANLTDFLDDFTLSIFISPCFSETLLKYYSFLYL